MHLLQLYTAHVKLHWTVVLAFLLVCILLSPGVLWLSHQTWIPKTCCYKLSSSYQVANLIHKWNSPLYLDSSTSPLSHASPPAGSKSLPSLQHYSSVQFHLILWAKWFFSSFTFLPHINSPVLSTSIKLTGFDAQASATRKIQVITQKSPRSLWACCGKALKAWHISLLYLVRLVHVL